MGIKTLLLSTVLFAAGIVHVFGATVPVEYPANPGQGFSWPYYLYVPPVVDSNAVLVVEPNNTGTGNDDFSVHDAGASNLITTRMTFAGDLHSPYLMPVFPEPTSNSWQTADPPEPATNAWVYTQFLPRDCFFITNPPMQRLDLQLMAMIADAKSKLATQGIETDPKVFILGFSASGAFANHFTALHPGLIKAAAVGSPGGWPLVPVATWSGETLRFPVGISDVGTLTGTNFDLTAFISVPHYFFIGDQDTNADQDAVWMRSSNNAYEQADSDQIMQLFGTNTQQRWPVAQSVYAATGCTNAQFVTYPGIAHNFTDQMRYDIEKFFQPARQFLTRDIHADLSAALNTTNITVNWATLSGLTYYMESSSNLTDWFPEGASNYLGDGSYQNYQTVLSNLPAKFFRLSSGYVPQGGGSGTGFFFYPISGTGSLEMSCATFSVTCSGLTNGICQTTIAGPGTFTYTNTVPSQAILVVNLTKGGQATFSLTMSNATSGVFQCVQVKSGVTNNLFGGSYETLSTP
jgi:pimeloyl-ACP methyl ester carboxylesterase